MLREKQDGRLEMEEGERRKREDERDEQREESSILRVRRSEKVVRQEAERLPKCIRVSSED